MHLQSFAFSSAILLDATFVEKHETRILYQVQQFKHGGWDLLTIASMQRLEEAIMLLL